MGGVSHQLLVAYLRGNVRGDEKEQIEDARAQDSKYELFFELVDAIRERTGVMPAPDDCQEIPVSHSKIETLLLRILSGKANSNDENAFINGLVCSQFFYERTIAKLSASEQASLNDVPEMAKIRVATNEEILSRVRADEKRASSAASESTTRQGAASSDSRRLFDLLTGSQWHLVFVAALVAIVVVTAFLLYSPKKSILTAYVYDHVVPYDPDSSSLRSATGEVSPTPEQQRALNQFNRGMSEYLARDYRGALQIFESLEANLDSPTSPFARQNGLELRTNVHFYVGLCYLALSRTRQEMNDALRTQYLQNSISHLAQSHSLIENRPFEDRDALTFFLGFARGLSGDEQQAVNYLQQVPTESRFFEDARKLIQEWSQNP